MKNSSSGFLFQPTSKGLHYPSCPAMSGTGMRPMTFGIYRTGKELGKAQYRDHKGIFKINIQGRFNREAN